MKGTNKIYTLTHLASAVFMMAALLWLTVSVAFIVPVQQRLNSEFGVNTSQTCNAADDEDCSPFGNTTEEKASGNSGSFSEEYLHSHHSADHFLSLIIRIHNSRNCDTYNAFHGEVHVPPPNIA
jgi:hypothetical protein